MKKLLKYAFIFLIINFGALAIGNWLMANGPQTQWYINLNKAPWTPPGWVFGAAWTTIMLCFSVYMAYLYRLKPNITVIGLFIIQFALNTTWGLLFFNLHFVGLGLTVILLLTFVVGVFTVLFKNDLRAKTLLILPYLLWLCIATSLNGYIILNN
ncbi:TspO/MBR family protein [Hyunsoonleella pacifica]|uniref:Tryptophan-rich sensory protein n=1 Tax=Hyunsoonleella pacifica TaxID=1080224 RepID=A0A4Q9FTH9_9FLAO|nr:TspO/MBR family protein [Hyunsoonleella pacifica]TBN19086.1 tryptophan-rich sensory protein [Hyunsoonleella pacifica]GGD07233.1 sensory protein TspO [Hyunsoonleella pacifica]